MPIKKRFEPMASCSPVTKILTFVPEIQEPDDSMNLLMRKKMRTLKQLLIKL
jgi:hypothetical protein